MCQLVVFSSHDFIRSSFALRSFKNSALVRNGRTKLGQKNQPDGKNSTLFTQKSTDEHFSAFPVFPRRSPRVWRIWKLSNLMSNFGVAPPYHFQIRCGAAIPFSNLVWRSPSLPYRFRHPWAEVLREVIVTLPLSRDQVALVK